MTLLGQVESILFVASKPLSPKDIARALGKQEVDIEEILVTLSMKYNTAESGIHLLQSGHEYQMASNPANAGVVERFVTDEIAGELTKAQLETLTVVAYRGPITRPELEEIRGVNCALILRNLLIRGLIEEEDQADKIGVTYRLSLAALRHVGVDSVVALPEYDTLHAHPHVEAILNPPAEPHV